MPIQRKQLPDGTFVYLRPCEVCGTCDWFTRSAYVCASCTPPKLVILAVRQTRHGDLHLRDCEGCGEPCWFSPSVRLCDDCNEIERPPVIVHRLGRISVLTTEKQVLCKF